MLYAGNFIIEIIGLSGIRVSLHETINLYLGKTGR